MDRQLVDLEQTKRRRTILAVCGWTLALAVFAVGAGTGSGGRVGQSDGDGWDTWAEIGERALGMGLLLTLCAVIALTVVGVQLSHQRELIYRIGAAEPGSLALAASMTVETAGDAHNAGASTRGIQFKKRTPLMAVAILPDRVEAWFLKESQPRWAVDREGATVGLVRVAEGLAPVWAIRVANGERSLHFVPRRVKGDPKWSEVELYSRVLTALGEDPAVHLLLLDSGTRRLAKEHPAEG